MLLGDRLETMMNEVRQPVMILHLYIEQYCPESFGHSSAITCSHRNSTLGFARGLRARLPDLKTPADPLGGHEAAWVERSKSPEFGAQDPKILG